MVMTQQQVGFVAFLAMLAIALTTISHQNAAGGEGVPGIPDPVFGAAVATNSPGPSISCIDSDGANFYSAGVVTKRYSTGIVAAEYADLCAGTQLREATCEGFVPYECPFGCGQGSCLSTPE